MSKRPTPEDEAEIVRQMEMLEGVDPSDVTMPDQNVEDPEIQEQMELLKDVEPPDHITEMFERHEAMMARLDAAYGGEQESVEETLKRARERHREIQESVAGTAPESQAGFSFSGAAKTGGNILSGFFRGAGAIGTAFKELGTGVFNAITDRPIGTSPIADHPTIFDLGRMSDEERLGSMDLSGVQIPELQEEPQPAQAEQQSVPPAPLEFPDTRIPKTKFSDPSSNEVIRQQKLISQALKEAPAPKPPKVQGARPDIAAMAEKAANETGKEVFLPTDAPDLFQQTSFGPNNDQQGRIIELLENLPRRISEELRS